MTFVQWGEARARARVGVHRYAPVQSNIKGSSLQTKQPSRAGGTESNLEKSFSTHQTNLQVFELQGVKKKSLSYLLIVFPFPFR